MIPKTPGIFLIENRQQQQGEICIFSRRNALFTNLTTHYVWGFDFRFVFTTKTRILINAEF